MSAIEVLSKPVDAGFPDEWYGFNSEAHFWFAWRLKALQSLLAQCAVPTKAPLKVLEVGCGTGAFRSQVEAVTDWIVDATDLNEAAVRACLPGRGRTLLYDVEDERSSMVRAYDVALLFDVLEHVGDVQPFLRSVLRHVKPGGWVIVNVPASNLLYSRYDRVVGHHRRYTKQSLAAELTSTSVRVECIDARYWGLSLFPVGLARRFLLHWIADEKTVVRFGFRPAGKLVNLALRALMHVETTLMSKPPIGTSLLCLVGVREEAGMGAVSTTG